MENDLATGTAANALEFSAAVAVMVAVQVRITAVVETEQLLQVQDM